MSNEENNTPEENQGGEQAPQDSPKAHKIEGAEIQGTEEYNVVNLEGMNGDEPLDLNPDALIDSLQKDLVEARDRTMRALADAENTRKRAQKDREDAGKYAVSSFARDLLDFSDNFKRALDAIPEDTPDAVRGGLEAMEREMLSTFDRHGIKKIEPLDEMFDANFHEVMFEAPMEGKQAGTIIQVIDAGYVLNDRLLRAAKVGIAKADPNADPGSSIDTQA